MYMMVTVSLDSKEQGRRGGVPAVLLGDRLVDAPLVLLASETVMLNVVNEFNEEYSNE